MAGTDDLKLIGLRQDMVPGASRLVKEADWNQTPDDWLFFIRRGKPACYVDPADRVVATAAVLPYGSRFGWISMVLVSKSWRRRGIASRLLAWCIDQLKSEGLVPVLDATPEGEAVYRDLGFAGGVNLHRWRANAIAAGRPSGGSARQVSGGIPDSPAGCDRQAFGADRRFLLADIARRSGARCWRSGGDGTGFLLSRRGRTARHIGPVCADSETTARHLLQAELSLISGPAIIDVPDPHGAIADLLCEAGFTPQRPFIRMQLGRQQPFGDVSRTFAIAGPEYG